MAKSNIVIVVDIEEIKQMKQKGFIGWSKYLLPYCRQYFDAGYSIAQVKDKLITQYGFDLSNETLSRMRLKYRRLSGTMPAIVSPVKSEAPIEQKKVGEENIQPSEEEALKDLVDAYNNHRLSRTQRKDPLDDMIAKQKRDRLLREQQAPPNE